MKLFYKISEVKSFYSLKIYHFINIAPQNFLYHTKCYFTLWKSSFQSHRPPWTPRTTSQELAMEPPRQYVIFWTLESLISAVSTPTVVFTILELMSIMMLHTTVAKSKLFQSMRFQTQLKKRHENVEAGSRFNVEDNATRWRLCESSALKKILTNISFTIF